jgi:hypothetical protein
VLHRVGEDTQGEIDSVRVSLEGTFAFRLPTVPDPERSEVYFASVRHAGVLYFGGPINLPIQLDSLYEIQAYDTIVAPMEGLPIPIQARNVFLEEGESKWLVTDLFQLRNDETRTLVAREGGFVWRYPLPAGAAEGTVSDASFAPTAAAVVDGEVIVQAPLSPGERLLVVRYSLPTPFVDLPMPGSTEVLEVLVKEPAPPLEATGLTTGDRVELEPGTTYRRFSGAQLTDHVLRLVEGDPEQPVPGGWLALILAMVLGSAGVWAIQRPGLEQPKQAPAKNRRALLIEVALLDEHFEAKAAPTAEERGAYESRRRALLRQLHSVA